jgi:hypothetical protein
MKRSGQRQAGACSFPLSLCLLDVLNRHLAGQHQLQNDDHGLRDSAFIQDPPPRCPTVDAEKSSRTHLGQLQAPYGEDVGSYQAARAGILRAAAQKEAAVKAWLSVATPGLIATITPPGRRLSNARLIYSHQITGGANGELQ